MRLRARVAALERGRAREPAPCRACGGPPGPGARIVLDFDRPGERPDGPERCPACGRQLVFRLEFDRQG